MVRLQGKLWDPNGKDEIICVKAEIASIHPDNADDIVICSPKLYDDLKLSVGRAYLTLDRPGANGFYVERMWSVDRTLDFRRSWPELKTNNYGGMLISISPETAKRFGDDVREGDVVRVEVRLSQEKQFRWQCEKQRNYNDVELGKIVESFAHFEFGPERTKRFDRRQWYSLTRYLRDYTDDVVPGCPGIFLDDHEMESLGITEWLRPLCDPSVYDKVLDGHKHIPLKPYGCVQVFFQDRLIEKTVVVYNRLLIDHCSHTGLMPGGIVTESLFAKLHGAKLGSTISVCSRYDVDVPLGNLYRHIDQQYCFARYLWLANRSRAQSNGVPIVEKLARLPWCLQERVCRMMVPDFHPTLDKLPSVAVPRPHDSVALLQDKSHEELFDILACRSEAPIHTPDTSIRDTTQYLLPHQRANISKLLRSWQLGAAEWLQNPEYFVKLVRVCGSLTKVKTSYDYQEFLITLGQEHRALLEQHQQRFHAVLLEEMKTPLSRFHGHMAFLEALLRIGVNMKNEMGENLLHVMFRLNIAPSFIIVSEGGFLEASVFSLWMTEPEPLHGRTPWHYLCFYGRYERFRALPTESMSKLPIARAGSPILALLENPCSLKRCISKTMILKDLVAFFGSDTCRAWVQQDSLGPGRGKMDDIAPNLQMIDCILLLQEPHHSNDDRESKLCRDLHHVLTTVFDDYGIPPEARQEEVLAAVERARETIQDSSASPGDKFDYRYWSESDTDSDSDNSDNDSDSDTDDETRATIHN